MCKSGRYYFPWVNRRMYVFFFILHLQKLKNNNTTDGKKQGTTQTGYLQGVRVGIGQMGTEIGGCFSVRSAL